MIRRDEAIAAILARAGESLVVAANGAISREACDLYDRPQNFYLLGSTGLASSIGLGLALTNPERRVIVVDGDGTLLMALGALSMIGEQRPANLVHVVLDDETHGGELDALAHAAGYAHVRRLDVLFDFDILEEMLGARGPAFLLIKTAHTIESDAPRVPHPPERIAERFRNAV